MVVSPFVTDSPQARSLAKFILPRFVYYQTKQKNVAATIQLVFVLILTNNGDLTNFRYVTWGASHCPAKCLAFRWIDLYPQGSTWTFPPFILNLIEPPFAL